VAAARADTTLQWEEQQMKKFLIRTFAVGVMSVLTPALAHETPNLEHTHAFQQTGYGTWRQGHYVNGPNGSIIIWSPRTYTGYQANPPVRFARPQPITRPPGSPLVPPKAGHGPGADYGDQPKRGYGD